MSIGERAPKARQPRSLAAAGRPFRATERDRSILETLAKLRFATTSHLAALHFEGSHAAAQKRLRKLLDARYVRAWVRDLAQENVYSLDRAGARMLAGDGEPSVVPHGLDGNLDHLLAINGLRVSLALGLSETGGEISWWQSDWELRARARAHVIPDALFAVTWAEGGARCFALEVDNRTRSARRFIRKIVAYRSLLVRGLGVYGIRNFVTLILGRDERWLERYRLVLGEGGLGHGIWFATLAALDEQGATSPVWRAADSDHRYSLRDLTRLPYGKQGSELKYSLFSEA